MKALSRSLTACLFLAGAAFAGTAQEAPTPPYVVAGDTIAQPLDGRGGDPARGAALMTDRHRSLCLLCHAGPFPDPHLHGTLAPSLAGIGDRLTEGQLRLRIVDMKALDPDSIMPTYLPGPGGGADDDRRIAPAWRGKPVLEAGEIEDLVAYLATLKAPR